jgi:hypothetical protein
MKCSYTDNSEGRKVCRKRKLSFPVYFTCGLHSEVEEQLAAKEQKKLSLCFLQIAVGI